MRRRLTQSDDSDTLIIVRVRVGMNDKEKVPGDHTESMPPILPAFMAVVDGNGELVTKHQGRKRKIKPVLTLVS